MKRNDIIKKVKVLLDEVSPFEEDDQKEFIDDIDEDFSRVKPIYTYINDQLNAAAEYCLKTLPFVMLTEDIEEEELQVNIDRRGVGHISDVDNTLRMVSVDAREWERLCNDFITPSDARYTIQQNPYRMAGSCKPVVAYVPETRELELYSFPKRMRPKDCMDKSCTFVKARFINTKTLPEKIHSNVIECVSLMAAAYVSEIMGDTDSSTIFKNRLATKIQAQ